MPYKRTKLEAERLVLAAGAVCVNPTTPVGEGDRAPTPTGAMIRGVAARPLPRVSRGSASTSSTCATSRGATSSRSSEAAPAALPARRGRPAAARGLRRVADLAGRRETAHRGSLRGRPRRRRSRPRQPQRGDPRPDARVLLLGEGGAGARLPAGPGRAGAGRAVDEALRARSGADGDPCRMTSRPRLERPLHGLRRGGSPCCFASPEPLVACRAPVRFPATSTAAPQRRGFARASAGADRIATEGPVAMLRGRARRARRRRPRDLDRAPARSTTRFDAAAPRSPFGLPSAFERGREGARDRDSASSRAARGEQVDAWSGRRRVCLRATTASRASAPPWRPAPRPARLRRRDAEPAAGRRTRIGESLAEGPELPCQDPAHVTPAGTERRAQCSCGACARACRARSRPGRRRRRSASR